MASAVQAIVGTGVMTVWGFIMWRRGMKVGRLSAGTATSKIATAAKGFVELCGTARPFGEVPLTDPVAYLPCLWFHVITEEKSWLGSEDDWKVVSNVTSERPFVIQDNTGYCVVSCAEKEVELGSPEVVKVKSTLRHKVWRLQNGDPLYALGHLDRLKDGEFRPEAVEDFPASTSPSIMAYEKKKKVTEHMMGLLKLWKQDQRKLIERFDADGNGRVDWQEWEKAQAMARGLAEKKLAADSLAVENALPAPKAKVADSMLEKITHKLVRPSDGRPLLISRGSEDTVTTRNRWHSFFGLFLFLCGAIGLFFLLSSR